MAKIDALENLPEINILEEEGITVESILNEMIADYEAHWKEQTGEELILYPADWRRIMLNVTTGKLYQLASIINERFKLNFLRNMYGIFLKNWGGNCGFKEDGIESATVILRFHLAAVQSADIIIPAGTRATSGDHIFFAIDEALVIVAGTTYADTNATCTTPGTIGNGYAIGQLNIIADPVNLVEKVENTSQSAGGHDEFTDQELRELIYDIPSVYSTAGPKACYRNIAMQYSRGNISDAKVITNKEAQVLIYVLLLNGNLPTEEYCNSIQKFIKESKVTPDTDKIKVTAPETVNYIIDATYYISEDKKDMEDGVKEAIEDAANEFIDYERKKIGRAINPNVLITYANAAGASRIEITSPVYKAIQETEVAICTGINLKYGGLDKE